jgi:uncharacterized protein involved in exopolysaccharide biosynthesis
MPTETATLPLQDLAQRINQELAVLRKEYEACQTQLTALARRKEELEAQLKQVEADMVNVNPAPATALSM